MNNANNPLSRVVEFFGRHREQITVEFPPGELVTAPEPLNIPLWGDYLNLPAFVAAVLVAPDGKQTVYRTGSLLNQLSGRYTLQFVDLRQQQTSFPNVVAETSDGWPVKLSLELVWEVTSPLPVAKMVRPAKLLEDACLAAVRSYVRTKFHDNLVPMPGQTLIPDADLSNEIVQRLEANVALKPFKFIGVTVLERLGDRQRLDLIQARAIEQTALQQQVQLQADKEALEIRNVQREVAVEQEKPALIDQQQQNAQQRQAGDLQLLRERTETELELEFKKLPIERQKVMLKLLQASQELRLEQLKVLAAAITEFTTTPGAAQRLGDPATIGQVLKALAEAVQAEEPPQPPPPPPPVPNLDILPAVRVRNAKGD